jgi:hypothetical protein
MNPQELEHYEAQAAIQEQAMQGQTSVYAPQMMEQIQQAQAVLVEQTNPNKVVKEIMLTLRGLEENPDGSLRRVGEAKMNEKGIRNVWVWCKGSINQGLILSHYEDHQISHIMDVVQQDFVDDLALNWREYGIKNKTDLDLINNVVLINIDACLRRALGQNEKNWLGKISIEQISGMPKFPKSKKEGFWSKFRL